MVASFFRPSTPNPYRDIKSSSSLATLYPIRKISVRYTPETSFLIITPSKINISATIFLTLISGNREFAKISPSYRVKRKDLILATESMIMDLDVGHDSHSMRQTAGQNATMATPKRPPNAFMLYSSSLRKKIKRTFPEYGNSDISKFLGVMWKYANDTIKQKFIQQAYDERRRHKMLYPDFEYNRYKNMSTPSATLQGGADTIQGNEDWCEEIQRFIQQTENFAESPYFSLEKMENEAIELLNSVSGDLDILEEPPMDEMQLMPNLQWINFGPMEEMDTNSWRDMCNSVSMLFPEGSDERILDCPY